jgi:hypothetical protein
MDSSFRWNDDQSQELDPSFRWNDDQEPRAGFQLPLE